MTAYINDLQQCGFAAAPVLIAVDSGAALSRAQRTVEAAGLRIGASVDIAAAPQRIEQQASASAVWVELDEDGGPILDRLLDRLNRDAAAGRYRSVVAAPASLIDALAARLEDSAVQIVIDGSESDRIAALATASTALAQAHRLSDVAADKGAERLRQLSDEVARIAAALARLSTGPQLGGRATEHPPSADLPDVSAETVRAVIRARRLRSRYFSEELFADPAWDMLLDLLHAEIAQLRVPVSSLCIAAAVPATTALRWLKTMTQQGLFVRRADPHDARRVFVELAPGASQAMRRYFGEAGSPLVV
jgi:DNA-binding MarR family transcriptional regulator